jgi:hypothetical protein
LDGTFERGGGMSERKDVLEGLEGFTPGPWEWFGNNIESRNPQPPHYGPVMDVDVDCGRWCQGGTPRAEISEPDRALIVRPPELVEEVRALREVLMHLCPAEEGFTEAFDYLIERGLLVEVPADEAYREEWDSDTMHVWRWSPLAKEVA